MAEQRAQRRLAAILAADVVGYSRLMESDEDGTLAALKSRRKDVLDPMVAKHQGRVFKTTGDGVLVEFASAVNAVQCAVELQQGMAAANRDQPEDRHVILRIGVNLGDVMVEGSDLYGDGINIAARLEAMAEPGGILVSGTAYDHTKSKVKVGFADLGSQALKNIAEPVRAYRVTSMPAVTVAAPKTTADKPSIAVLPFANMSGDPEQEYFSDGMVEEIITALSRFHWLFVIARNSSFAYKGRSVDVKQVGRELGVRYVLEGSVRKAGGKVRIAGQLIDASTGLHIWADRFDGALEDIFDLQDRVTASVVGAIAPKLQQAEIERSRRKPTDSLDAYDCYLRGFAAFLQWNREANAEALKWFERAIQLDPKFASAYGMAARCYCQIKAGGWQADRDREIVEAGRLARQAVETGRDDAVALCSAGFAIAYVVGDIEDGDAMIEKALLLNPNLAWAWYSSGWVKIYRGEPEMAIERVGNAMRLSPHDPHAFIIYSVMAYAHFLGGRYAEATSWAEAALRDRPEHLSALRMLAASAAMMGRHEQAGKAMKRMRELDPILRLSNLSDLIPLRRQEHRTKLADALRKAGLQE